MDGEISFRVIKMKAITATPENFRPFGQVVGPSPDGAPYGPEDAQLKLDAGIPRFYIINLKGGALRFNSITHHASVTQCLGSVGGHTWYVGVARSSIVEKNELASNTLDDLKKAIQDDNSLSVDESIKQHFHGKKVVHSKAAHYYVPPAPEDVQVFRVEGPQFLKLDIGTWHAGPLFKESSMDFYNLELSNTNEVDHTTHVFRTNDGVGFVIED